MSSNNIENKTTKKNKNYRKSYTLLFYPNALITAKMSNFQGQIVAAADLITVFITDYFKKT